MARFSRLEVYNAMLSSGLVPIFYNGDTRWPNRWFPPAWRAERG